MGKFFPKSVRCPWRLPSGQSHDDGELQDVRNAPRTARTRPQAPLLWGGLPTQAGSRPRPHTQRPSACGGHHCTVPSAPERMGGANASATGTFLFLKRFHPVSFLFLKRFHPVSFLFLKRFHPVTQARPTGARACEADGVGRVKSLEDAGLRNRPVPHARKIPPFSKTIKMTVSDTSRLSRMKARAD